MIQLSSIIFFDSIKFNSCCLKFIIRTISNSIPILIFLRISIITLFSPRPNWARQIHFILLFFISFNYQSISYPEKIPIIWLECRISWIDCSHQLIIFIYKIETNLSFCFYPSSFFKFCRYEISHHFFKLTSHNKQKLVVNF